MIQKKKKLLLICEDRSALDDCKLIFEGLGFWVFTAHSEQYAKSITQSDKSFHAVILDVKLPEDRASALLTHLRKTLDKHAILFTSPLYLGAAHAKRLESEGVIQRLASSTRERQKLADEFNRKINVQPQLAYDANVINCFIRAIGEVIDYYTGDMPQLSKPSLKPDHQTAIGFVTALTVLSGKNVIGSTSVTCDKGFISSLAPRVTGVRGAQVLKDDVLVGDVAKELCDQIFGRARISLLSLGYEFSVGLPEVVIGEKHVIKHRGNSPVLSIPFTLAKDCFYVEFCIDKK